MARFGLLFYFVPLYFVCLSVKSGVSNRLRLFSKDIFVSGVLLVAICVRGVKVVITIKREKLHEHMSCLPGENLRYAYIRNCRLRKKIQKENSENDVKEIQVHCFGIYRRRAQYDTCASGVTPSR